VELQERYDEITKEGLGLLAISYDDPETLKRFAESRKITFPLIADPGSAIIKRFGLLNNEMDPKTRFYGVPHPGTFIVDRNGVVVSRFFEDAYHERYTAATILAGRGVDPTGPAVTARTGHLTMRASITETSVAPGERFALVVSITPHASMHLYAPGKHTYQVVRLVIDQQPWLRIHEIQYPPSEMYHFKPLDERVEVYAKPFRLVQDLTILATPEVQKSLSTLATVTISGALEYQACDDTVCYNPARVPVSFTLATKPLDRRPPGEF
jgi:hypothetical protein